MSDQLSLRIKPGDEQGLELLLRKFYVRLHGYANKYLNHQEEKHEVIQGAFTKIWEAREDIDREESLIHASLDSSEHYH